mmetsp:Transcript_39429/g.61460  ORF Transcript_39429/g.61460 Transcript_39429/m.61460 type:complete len:290 (-) Transcript_39429:80-949(-)
MNFKILKLIDYGTYGKVYRISCEKERKNYATKVMIRNLASKNYYFIWKRELDILFCIKHPNIIFAKEYFLNSNISKICIIMNYSTYNLKNLICSPLDLSLFQLRNILKQILTGISCMHDNWIIHRDIKSSNILISNNGVVKICDFGLSRFWFPGHGSLTQGVVTLWYRSPELLLGQKIYSKAIDSWSIGCIMGELITKEVLFPGKSELDQLGKIFSLLGIPTMEIWISLHKIFNSKAIIFPLQPYNTLHHRLRNKENFNMLNLLQRLLTYDPRFRISTKEALSHPFLTT